MEDEKKIEKKATDHKKVRERKTSWMVLFVKKSKKKK